MATIKTLNINLTMGVAAFTKGTKSVVGQIKKMTDAVFSFKGALVGLGAAMVANSAVDWIGGHIAAIDGLNDSALKIGTSVQNLSELGYAAQLSGSSLDGLQNGLAKMTAVLGKADEDSDKAAEKFKELGLSAEQLQSLDPAEAFLQIGEAIAGLPNQYQRVAAATAIFGKSAGPELVALLSQGRAGIAELRKEAQDFGVSVSEVQAAKIAMAADALDRMKAIWQGIGQTLAIEVSPFIVAIAKGIGDFAKGGKFVSFIRDAFRGFLAVLAKVLDALESIAGVIKGTVNFIAGAKDVLASAVGAALPGGNLAAMAIRGKTGQESKAPQTTGESLLSGFDATFDKIQKEADKEAKKMAASQAANRDADRLATARATADRLEAQKDAFRIGAIHAAQAGPAEIFKKMAEEAVKLEEDRKAASKKIAGHLKDSLKSPSEKLAEQLTEIRAALKDGFLDGGSAMKWRNKTLEDLKKQEEELTKTETRKIMVPNALKRGSAEEMNAVSSFFSGGQGLEPIKQLDKTQKEQLKEIKKQTKLLENIKPVREEILK